MSFFKSKKERAEQRGYRKIIAKKNIQAGRQAYAEESEKVARERAKAKARGGSGWSKVGSALLSGAARVATPRRATPVRRTVRRTARKITPIRRKVSRRSYAPTRRTSKRKTKRSYAPVRKRKVRRTVKSSAPTQPRAPQNLNEAIYGGD